MCVVPCSQISFMAPTCREFGQSTVQSVKYPKMQATWIVSTAPRPGLVPGQGSTSQCFELLKGPLIDVCKIYKVGCASGSFSECTSMHKRGQYQEADECPEPRSLRHKLLDAPFPYRWAGPSQRHAKIGKGGETCSHGGTSLACRPH